MEAATGSDGKSVKRLLAAKLALAAQRDGLSAVGTAALGTGRAWRVRFPLFFGRGALDTGAGTGLRRAWAVFCTQLSDSLDWARSCTLRSGAGPDETLD